MSTNFSWLIIGLGNPGAKYAHTRHNFGFMTLSAFLHYAERHGVVQQLSGNVIKNKCHVWRCSTPTLCPEPWLAATPLTFMNLSGLAVAEISNRYYVQPERILVVHDELDLPFGRIKLKSGGGLAGHNGLKSIAEHLGSKNFHRLRMGIHSESSTEAADFVLAEFSRDELLVLEKIILNAVRAIQIMLSEGVQSAMNSVNSASMILENSRPSSN